ncbi:DsrE family protein [Oceanicoccus sp. KOV_DT_Chl]|uniref:DsrE family protein n=1 Tax=Oceanicoccus sp. KOV_DT_Chl TaxID=1904639 RepID=UPI000C7BDB47|nr:DsrE family protein [Oceanicoccus sp. KOV_DT_Chl]
MATRLVVCCMLLFSIAAKGQNFSAQLIPIQENSPRYISHLEVHTAAELNQLLLRAEKLFDSGEFMAGVDTPVAFVLHGPEVLSLLKVNYAAHKSLVDLAARLSAFRVVDIKVCRTWMGVHNVDDSQLPPFISTVPFGPDETTRLMEKEKYVYF